MLNLKTKRIVLSLVSVFLFLSVAAPVFAAGLVNCGNEGQPACTLTDLIGGGTNKGLIGGIIDFILATIVPVLAVAGFVIAGIMMMTSAGDPGKFQKAKLGMIWIVIGVIIVYGAWFIVTSFVTAIGGQSWTLQFFGK
jgi:type IV secretory pathway VirB2 component (pilin)